MHTHTSIHAYMYKRTYMHTHAHTHTHACTTSEVHGRAPAEGHETSTAVTLRTEHPPHPTEGGAAQMGETPTLFSHMHSANSTPCLSIKAFSLARRATHHRAASTADVLLNGRRHGTVHTLPRSLRSLRPDGELAGQILIEQ